MGYFIAFGLVYIGYSLVDWGHYVVQHKSVSLWWLMSGLGNPPSQLSGTSSDSGTTQKPVPGVSPGSPAVTGHNPRNVWPY